MSGLASFLPISLAAFLVIVMPVGFAIQQNPPRAGEPVLVFGPPWQSVLPTALRGDAKLIAPGRRDFVALVYSDNPKFIDHLYDTGAWLVLDGALSDLFCQPT